MSTVATLAIILAIALAVTVWGAYRRDPARVARWATARGLDLTDESRALVAGYLRRARVYRAWGAVAGAALPTVVSYVVDGRVVVLGFGTDGNSAPLGFGAIFVGYLIGALCAEAATVRRVRGPRRVAGLAPRELPSYLPRRAVLAQRAAALAAAAGTLAIAAVPYPPATSTPGTAALALAAVLALAFGAGLEALERWIVVRSQPFADPAVVAADDAIRAHSIRAVAGAGLALLLLFCCGIALALQASDVDALQTAMVVPAAACFVLSLLAFAAIGDGGERATRAASA
jgi:hypothetical protein